MSAVEQAARTLLLAAIDVKAALDREDGAELAAALTRREKAFDGLRVCVEGPVSAAVQSLLREIGEIDAVVLERAEAVGVSMRLELADLRRAREAARALEPRADPPRFISRHA